MCARFLFCNKILSVVSDVKCSESKPNQILKPNKKYKTCIKNVLCYLAYEAFLKHNCASCVFPSCYSVIN